MSTTVSDEGVLRQAPSNAPRPPTEKDERSGLYRGLEHLIGDDASSKYIKRKLLGTGSFGSTWRVEDRETGGMFAAKVMVTEHMAPKDKGFLWNEIRSLQRCDHPNILRHIISVDVNKMSLLIVEFADGGDLCRQVKARQQGTRYFREHEILFIFVQLCLALDHIHSNRMMHRDIKTANVLLTTTGLVKVGNFGFSRQFEESLSEAVGSTFCGNPYYLSPELWKRAPYSKKSEMWALGVVLYEIMTLHRPFAGANLEELVDNIVHGRRGPLPPHYSNDLQNIVDALLSVDPQKRPSIRGLFRLDYLRDRGCRPLQQFVMKNSKLATARKNNLLSSIDSLLTRASEEALAESGVMAAPREPKRGTVQQDLGPLGWVSCQLSITGEIVEIKNANETVHIESRMLSSVCPIDEVIANESCVFAMKTKTGDSYWFKTRTAAEQEEWLIALQEDLLQ